MSEMQGKQIFDSDAGRQERLEAFQDWRFGIFVHWVLFAGHKEVTRELMEKERTTHAIARAWDARANRFDAAEWAAVFQASGARYVTFVPRHFMDFALTNTQLSDYQSQRDYAAEVLRECRRRNLPVGLYVNLATGLLHDYHPATAEFGLTRKAKRREHDEHLTAWLQELCESYHPDMVWLDGWPGICRGIEKAGLKPLDLYDFRTVVRPVREFDPTILIGNKEILAPYIDFLESEWMFRDHFGEPLSRGAQVSAEVCDFLPGNRWQATYREQVDFLTPKEIKEQTRYYIQRLVTCTGRGINYLLNVGPLPNGELQRVEVAMLQRMGTWLRANGEAIYGTRPGPLADADWGYNVIQGDRIYLHVLDNRGMVRARGRRIDHVDLPLLKHGVPSDGQIRAGPLPWPVGAAYLLDGGHPVSYAVQGDRIRLDLSTIEPDLVDTIIVLVRGQ